MPKEHEKIKYSPGDKSLKAPLIIYADLECLLKKCDLVKIILKIGTLRKKLSTNLQDTHGVQYDRLMRQKTDVIFIGKKIKKLSLMKSKKYAIYAKKKKIFYDKNKKNIKRSLSLQWKI